jgi:hypothetical protein
MQSKTEAFQCAVVEEITTRPCAKVYVLVMPRRYGKSTVLGALHLWADVVKGYKVDTYSIHGSIKSDLNPDLILVDDVDPPPDLSAPLCVITTSDPDRLHLHVHRDNVKYIYLTV